MALSTNRIVDIFIELEDEGTFVLGPASASEISPGVFRILRPKNYDPVDEKWKFPPSTIVSCKKEIRKGEMILVADKRIR